MATNRCSVGENCDEECFLTHFVKKDVSIFPLDGYDNNIVRTIKYRAKMENVPSICNHHLAAYSKYFEHHVNRSTNCSDPCEVHLAQVKIGVKNMSLQLCDSLQSLVNTPSIKLPIFPGMKLCNRCYSSLLSLREKSARKPTTSSSSMEDIETVSDDVFFSPLRGVKIANQAAEVLGISPMQVIPKESQEKRINRILKKGEEIRGKFEQSLQQSIAEDINISYSSDNGNFTASDLENLMSDLKERCIKLRRENDHSSIISLLTLAPPSWSISATASYFNVSHFEVRRARILKSEKGVLEIPDKKKGRRIAEEERLIIKEFYETDENSRMQPGMKDTVAVRIEEGQKKVKVQRRLLLMNIDELYSKYKDYCSKTLSMKPCGRTKFFMFRPEHVLEVGCKGTHNVCVCEKHQNVKLMIDALCRGMIEKDLYMDKIVCDVKCDCMLKRCKNCPGIESLRSLIVELIGDRTSIKYKMWVSTDRAMLEQKECSASDFIDAILEKIDALTIHHFVAKAQSKFCRELKSNIPLNECLIQGDFSQNYSMYVQDSTQASFFNPVAQATIHPFVIYVNQNGKITPHSAAVISDCNNHNTVAVHSFLKPVINYVKLLCPTVNKLLYFTDGAASQYKNYKNLANLACHLDDFGLSAEWHFFATSHGKGPCDGIGGTIKRLARRKSLQCVNNSKEDIQTPQALFEFAANNIQNIKVFYVSADEVSANE